MKQTLTFILRAFRHRNYRLFFGGQGLSLVGTWMQQIAVSWLVYRLSGSALVLGLVGFVGQSPALFAAPVAGVLADRFNRHRLLIILQVLAMIQASLLAFLTLSGLVAVWHLFLLAAFLGFVNAFEIPTRQSFVIDMLDRNEDLGNAIALNSFMFNSSRLVGPSIAGVIIGLVGEGICFFLNAISFLAIIIALVAMRIQKRTGDTIDIPLLRGLREGFSYAFDFMPIRYILILLGLVSLAGMPYLVLMPVFAKDVLHGGPQTLGFLLGASGIGALIGALVLASRASVVGTNKLLSIGTLVFGASLIGFSFSTSVVLSFILMVFTGFHMILVMVSSNIMLQTIAEEDKRGRIISLYVLALMGTAPFGSLLAGIAANHIGAPNTLLAGGIVCILASLFFYLKLPAIRAQVQPIYRQLGLIEEMPSVVK
jgi:MFS family permease